jgi:hypothetical protein
MGGHRLAPRAPPPTGPVRLDAAAGAETAAWTTSGTATAATVPAATPMKARRPNELFDKLVTVS